MGGYSGLISGLMSFKVYTNKSILMIKDVVGIVNLYIKAYNNV